MRRKPYYITWGGEFYKCPACKSGKVAACSRQDFVREALLWLLLLLLSATAMYRFVKVIQREPVTPLMAAIPLIAAGLAVPALTKCIETVMMAIMQKQVVYECRRCKGCYKVDFMIEV